MEVKVGRRSYLKWISRSILALVLLLPFFFPVHFIDHFRAHFSGSIENTVVTGEWHVVLISIVLFVSFLIPLSFRKKVSWKEYGLVAAFFISLFVEMYGIPLTIMFLSRTLDSSGKVPIDTVVDFRLFGVGFGLTLPMVYGAVLMFIGTVIVIVGWITLYRRIDREGLVTGGIYSISRHPQYLGFLMVIYGWVIGWTTALTVVFGIILFIMYIRVCVKEEKEMGKDHDYLSYKKKVPFFV
jgi:protein-S-isoprenylcysteine O-methyltransferase Ste14